MSHCSHVTRARPSRCSRHPFELRGRMLRNRIVSTPHATGWSHDGLIAQSEIDYHVRKAAGGVGLVMTFGSASVDPTTEALVRVDRPVGRAQRAGAACAGRRRPSARGALHVADDPHGAPWQLPHVWRTAARPRTCRRGHTSRCRCRSTIDELPGHHASGSPAAARRLEAVRLGRLPR